MDKYITIAEAAKYAGYMSTSTLKAAAISGALRTERPSPNLRLTTKKWVDDYMAKHPRPVDGPGKGVRGESRRRRPTPEETP